MMKPKKTDNRLVLEPENTNDDEALHEYGRQLALDSLLRGIAPNNVIEMPPRVWNRRAWISASVASLAGVAGFSLWKFGQGDTPLPEQVAKLDPRWILEVAADAKLKILGSNHIKIIRGEIRLTSREPAHILVETPTAKATAEGTDFLIGTLQTKQTNDQTKNMKMNTLTRLLVLAGTVTLATAQGTKTAAANEAVVAKNDLPPEKIVVRANSNFAFNLYSQLAAKNGEENLFFSPYSISNALMMVAEGARKETAKEMGTVLGFPEALARSGEGSQNIPWEMSVIRSGQSTINQWINSQGETSPEQQKLLDEEAAIKKRWNKMNGIIDEAGGDNAFYSANKEVYHQTRTTMRALNKQLKALRLKINPIKLRNANAVWTDNTCKLNNAWQERVSNVYGVGAVQKANFLKQPEDERSRINAWVAKQTENRIEELFSPSTITSRTRLVLANAIYFKGDWMEPFDERSTEEKSFALSSGKEIKTPFMFKYEDNTAHYAAFNADGSYFNTPKNLSSGVKQPATYPNPDGFAMVEMPYRGNNVSMVILAPNDPKGLPALEKQLNISNVEAWISKLEKRKTNIRLPKFKLATTYDLSETLSAMGMPSAFDRTRANFSGLSNEELYIDNAIHKAFLEVSEKGTEAAAATGMVFSERGKITFIPFHPTFNVDRPFIYLIRDRKSGAILFLGRVLDPT